MAGDKPSVGKRVTENGVEVDLSLYESWAYSNLRARDTRWTPINDQVLDLINIAYRECGSNWSELCRQIGMSERHMRKIRNRDPEKGVSLTAVSFTIMDKILGRSRVGYMLNELPWYTVEEMLTLGYWSPTTGWTAMQWGNRNARKREEKRVA